MLHHEQKAREKLQNERELLLDKLKHFLSLKLFSNFFLLLDM
mgnify:CR=1 FL=1